MSLNTDKYSYNEYQIYSSLRSKSYSLAVICGILSCIEYKTNFNPHYNSVDGYGLCSWRDTRRQKLGVAAGLAAGVVAQMNFMHKELHSDAYKDTLSKFNSVPDTREGAIQVVSIFATHYMLIPLIKLAADLQDISSRAGEFYDYYKDYTGNNGMTPTGSPGDSEDVNTPNLPHEIVLATFIPYQEDIRNNYTRISEMDGGFSYGYLIDLSSSTSLGKKEFKFYIPEYSDSAGVNYSDIAIPGRSVSLKYYNSTNSRAIDIKLELFAGEGLYKEGSDLIGLMYDDIHFVKSLEYPNYEGTFVSPPPTVQLILGSSINMVGVVSDVVAEYHKPVDSKNRSMYVTLSFRVTQVASNPPGVKEIRRGEYTILGTEVRE